MSRARSLLAALLSMAALLATARTSRARGHDRARSSALSVMPMPGMPGAPVSGSF